MNRQKEKLDQIVLDIEFLLISVVQGVAVVTLAEVAVEPMSNLDFKIFPYVISAFLLVIVFWSQAIIHALSFIDWPMDLTHSFLYFLVGLIEVMAFHQMGSPLKWFGFMTFFFIAAGALYLVDLYIVKRREDKFKKDKQLLLYNHILNRQNFEFKFFIPFGLLFSFISFLLVSNFPTLFIEQNYHVLLVMIQAVFGIIVLANSIQSFKQRSKLLSNING